MKGVIFTIISIILLVGGGFTLGYNWYPIQNDPRVLRDTVLVTERDTLPVAVDEWRIESVPEPFPFYITMDKRDTVFDTVYVSVPMVQKVFEGDLYKAYVSGYKPNLDSINVYSKTIYVKEKEKKFGVGVGVSYGLGPDGFSPSVGISLYYNIFRF